ncbi:MAG: transcription factor TFIIIC subunit tfc4 [Bathelium mastoideum]|nr:MAG: transcription factor TFIIIC subunit tfc4 [Bathelium mastoideum]
MLPASWQREPPNVAEDRETLEDEEGDDCSEAEDEREQVAWDYNPAYDEINNGQSSLSAGPYYALQEDNITVKPTSQQQDGDIPNGFFRNDLDESGEIFYDPNTSEEEELQEIAQREESQDLSFPEENMEPSDDMSRSSGSEDSEELRGEGRRGSRPRGRARGAAAGRATRGRGWKWALKGTEHDPARTRSPPRRTRGIRRRAKIPAKRGPKAVRPTAEFQQTMARANTAYLMGDFEDVLELAREAILLNPEVFSAHSLLSQVLDEMGRPEDALGALLAGAHTIRDPQVWYTVAQRTAEMEGTNRNDVLEQQLYCYSQVLTINQQEYKARLERAKIYMELDREGRVKNECEVLLKHHPPAPEIVRMLAKVSSTDKEVRRAWEVMDTAFQTQMEVKTRDSAEMDWSDLILYLNSLCKDREYPKARLRLSEISRWFLGRRTENFWDDITEDDREWDMEDMPRRIETPNFQPGRHPEQSYGAGMPLEIRVKLGLIRLSLGRKHYEEAVRHFQHLQPKSYSLNAPTKTHDTFLEDVAKSLKACSLDAEAITYYEALLRAPRQQDWKLYVALAECYREVGRKIKSRECLRDFIAVNEQHMDIRVILARWCEEDGEPDEASELIAEVIRLARKDSVRRARLRALRAAIKRRPDLAKPPGIPLTAAAIEANEQASTVTAEQTASAPKDIEMAFPPKQPQRQVQTYDDDLQEMYQKLKDIENSGALAEPEALEDWLTIAEVMTEDFRAMKMFYRDGTRFEDDQNLATASAISEMKALALRMSHRSSTNQVDPTETLPPDYCGISWEAWLDLFCQYALQLAKLQEAEACYAALTATVDSTVFHTNEDYMKHVHVCWLACGLLLEDEQTVCNVARWFIKRYPYTNDAINLFSVVNRLLRCEPNWYNSGPSQKFVLRQIKGMDYALLDRKVRDTYGFTEMEKRMYGDPETDDNPHGLTELDPTLLMLYGHLLAVTGSYSNALNYYFRAYTVQPDNHMIVLCLGLNYIHMSMKRQAENRQFHIQQGLALISRYYELRTAADVAIHVQEAEFNRANVWHILGLNHLAIPGFEKCLALSERIQKEYTGEGKPEDFAVEAAFSLQNILAMSGNLREARAIGEKWLVL